ncbi:MAG TPA: tetratricopeptide repeat protein [Candidatus Sulfotelmatobacter sp.]|nr:tetratricopeptide repeat protein [Candidatus Sulfotelmatobacter sp.]
MSEAAGTSALRGPGRATAVWAAAAIALSVLAAYHDCLRAPFVFDDISSITENASIRRLWPLWLAFSPPSSGATVGGRPVANLTLAVNYALSGTDPWSYHAVNMILHALAGMTLFGVLRRTLARPVLRGRFGRDATLLSLAAALLWTLHPLQTEAVTYVIQRVESLMGLFYLLTIYLFIRSADSPRPLGWQACAVAACLLGMATKEVMATAPVVVMLYDRTFVAGSFRDAWRQRRGLYLALAATWLPLGFLAAGVGWSRGGSAGFSAPVAPAAYWMVQFEAVARYLWLSLWPHPLVFDYGTLLVRHPGEAAFCALVVLALVGATLCACRAGARPALGFLGAWTFLILAPSSVVPVATQTVAEHRMYLPLAAVMVLLVLGVYSVAGRKGWVFIGLLALGLGILTERRNEDYGSAVRLWRDTVSKRPDNARAHCALGFALYSTAGGLPEAISEFEAALRIEPGYSDAENDLGMALEETPGRSEEAIRHFEEALRLRPEFAQAHYNLGIAFTRARRIPEAVREYEEALRVQPEYPEACNNFGNLLCAIGRRQEGIEQLETAVRLRPDYAKALFDLGNALVQAGRIPDAIGRYEAALRIKPDFAEANNNLGMILCRSGHVLEGLEHIEAAIRTEPGFAPAHYARGTALLQLGRRDEAVAEYERVLQLRPNDPVAAKMLELIRATH